MFTSTHYALMVLLGIAGGFLNVMAGGGSLITVPALILMGAPPALSNGSNRVALIFQNVAAVAKFRRSGFSDWRLALTLSLAALPGATLGALLAVKIDGQLWQRTLAVVMLFVLPATLTRSRKKTTLGVSSPAGPSPRLAHLGMVVVGLYGGFLQVGVGFLIMALLRHTVSSDLVRVNVHKVIVVGLYAIPSLAVFALAGQVHWLAGAALAAGSALGAWVAAHVQLSRGEGPVRIVFALAVLAMAAKLIWG